MAAASTADWRAKATVVVVVTALVVVAVVVVTAIVLTLAHRHNLGRHHRAEAPITLEWKSTPETPPTSWLRAVICDDQLVQEVSGG